MTREEAKELLPIIQAYAEGKTIQFLDGGKWADVYETDFYQSPDKYRIKLEPNYRPFNTQEECWNEMALHQPFGWVKSKDNGRLYCIGEIAWSQAFGAFTITFSTKENISYSSDFVYREYTFLDGSPFGIKK